jgi:hypothetical protein
MKTNILRLTINLFFIGAIIFMAACSPPKEVEKLTFLQKVQITNEDTTDGSQKFQGDAHSGKYFSHTDSISGQYGTGTNFFIPDSLLQKTLRVKVNAWVRQGDLNEKNQLAVSLESNDGVVFWQAIPFKNHIAEINKWINVNDSITISGDLINKTGLLVKIFPFNPETTSYLDVDDEEVSIYKVDKVILK